MIDSSEPPDSTFVSWLFQLLQVEFTFDSASKRVAENRARLSANLIGAFDEPTRNERRAFRLTRNGYTSSLSFVRRCITRRE